MAGEIKATEQQETGTKVTEQQKETPAETTKEEAVDVEKVKSDAVAEYLQSLGYGEDELKVILEKDKAAKAAKEANKTELEKKDDVLRETTARLVAEREARMLADAKLIAIELGAKPDMVEDLVAVAKSKVMKGKDIAKVIAEIKDGKTGKAYFASEEEQKQQKTHKNVTRKNVDIADDDENKNEGTMAARLWAKKRKTK
jgi:hypothetical protein|nr:MAG TPA: hypothetical protein [Caudoviricetes sp.]